MLDYTQASRQGRQSSHTGGKLSSLCNRLSAFRLSSLWTQERGFKKQMLRQWRASENCNDEVAERTVKRILWDMDTCSHSEVKLCYWEKRWLCWEVGIWPTEIQLHVPVLVIIPVLKEKALVFDSPSYILIFLLIDNNHLCAYSNIVSYIPIQYQYFLNRSVS